jgi:hypothetical protein
MVHRVEQGVMAGFRKLFPRLGPLRSVAAKPLKSLGQRIFGNTNTDTIRSGNWYGNDTTWRMVLDLNRMLLYADRNGDIQDHPLRRVFCIVDGIVGGEGNGPLDPSPKPAGIVLAGANPVAVDLASACLMGFDYRRLPVLYRSLLDHPLPLAAFEYNDVVCRSNAPRFDQPLSKYNRVGLAFIPHFGWQGHIERACTQTREASATSPVEG